MAETLGERIARHIKFSGPLPLAEYMHWCMADKTQGYYTSHATIGRSGDFITAPEISQMFGELIGAWAVHVWEKLDRPCAFNLVELGPGHGTLMKDMLRTTGLSEAFTKAANIQLIETSPRMVERQRETLGLDTKTEWHGSIADLPELPTILIANEFLDVLPFRQYVKSATNWHERCVGLDDKGNLCWVLGDCTIEASALPKSRHNEPEGAVFEISTARESHIAEICELIASRKGAALYIDYGHLQSGFGDTFQAIKDHQTTDPLAEPGFADLTNHVDFEALANVIEQHRVTSHPFINQGKFLLALGLLERSGRLGTGKSPEQQAVIKRQAERLALPNQMGDLFKVLCISNLESLWPFG